MSRINLLPSAYRVARHRYRNFRIGMFVGAGLLGIELAAGMVLHARAKEARDLIAAAESAGSSAVAMQKALAEPQKEAMRLSRQVQLAERLRSKHRWSRLLAVLAQAMPQRVVLASLSTEPTQWSTALRPVTLAETEPNATVKNQKFIEGVSLQGHAADHADLSALISALHASHTFSDLDLKQARREKYMNQDAISFELDCRW